MAIYAVRRPVDLDLNTGKSVNDSGKVAEQDALDGKYELLTRDLLMEKEMSIIVENGSRIKAKKGARSLGKPRHRVSYPAVSRKEPAKTLMTLMHPCRLTLAASARSDTYRASRQYTG